MSLLPQPTARRHLRRLEAIPSSASVADAVDTVPLERWAWTLVWLGVLTGGINLWGFWWSSPVTVALAALLVLAGVAGTAACWLTGSPRSAWLQRPALGAALASAAVPQAVMIHTRTFYSTDSAAFDDVSAHALVHGVNPYTASMAPAARLLSVPDHYWTYTVTGSHVMHASYPAGSFLVDVPAILLGLDHQVVDWVDLAAWLLTGVLLFALLPVTLRWLAALVTITPIFVGMFGNSGTDAPFLPLLILAVWRWDRFALGTAAGPVRFMGPVALGLACAVKQLPWFCVPFLVVGVAVETRRAGRRGAPVATAYVAVVVAVFAAVNLPFVVWQPGAWFHGTLAPFVDPLVADGQGLVTLATHGLTGGADLGLLDVAGALAYLSVVAAFVVWYPAMKRIWPLLLPVAFFFSARSLSSYLVDLFPMAVVAAVTVAAGARPPSQPRPAVAAPWARLRGLLGARPALLMAFPVTGVVVVSLLAFSAAPLQLAVRSVRTSHAGRSLDAVTVTVHNRTAGALTPHFLVNTGSSVNGFWATASDRPVVIGPHASRTVTLRPPVGTGVPQHGARWLVEAYTSGPRWLSTSPLIGWRRP
ncbi:MAG TPA: hypothetical protein VMV22_13150 [Acidimicrobiales bacterium]|nr:hypothetical protein [Acidimicrobiales bacterium]